tara:strand:- start:2242 stop:2844 length:603 start_codon:yes stop_codon:yes gene_type:complete
MGITSIAKKIGKKVSTIGKKVVEKITGVAKKTTHNHPSTEGQKEEKKVDVEVDEFSGEEAKKRGPEKHLTSKYNYAGPGTEYRARMKGSDFYEKMMNDAGRKLVGTKPYNKAINKLDACAKIHDKVYSNPKATAAQVKEADRVFQKCSSKVKVSDGIEQKLLSVAGRAGFEGKIALESVGVLRKGSFASGGNKKRSKRDP